MKKLATFLTILAVALAQTAVSQDITLRFTGATTSGDYVRLDSVKVQNVSRSWNETVVYPDTVMSFACTGIAEARGLAAELSAYPNPFNGTTNVSVTLPQSGNAVLQLFNVAGQKVAERSLELQSGSNLLEVRLQNPQVYLLAVTTPQGRSTIKLLNSKVGEGNGISLRGNVVEKRQSSQRFQSGDFLKIVGYATSNGSVVVSQEIQQAQTASDNFTLIFPPEGALSGLFSVSSTHRVRFSRGNLQWSASGTHAVAGGNTRPGTWRFAPNQWDTIGSQNSFISSYYNGWIDLFGWATSGYHNSSDSYNTRYNPYDTANSELSDWTYNTYGYGPSINRGFDTSLTGSSANYDWGVYNAISNGGNRPGMWRTLTKAEWDTLLNHRTTASGVRYAKAEINGIGGLIIVPDNWDTTIYALNRTNVSENVSYSANMITSAQWVVLEAAGCAFLPSTGYRYRSSIYRVGTECDYWTSTNCSKWGARVMIAGYYSVSVGEGCDERFRGLAVRLVQDE